MASVFVALRISGDITNDEARSLEARLTDLISVCESVGLDVKRSVDVRLDPEVVVDETHWHVTGFDLATSPDATAVVAVDPAVVDPAPPIEPTE